MKIFDWAKEIERIYEELIEKTKNENLAEIQALREEQEKILGRSIEQKQTIVNNALKVLSEKVNKEIESFESKLNYLIDELKNNYDIKKPELTNLLLKKIGLDFYGK